MVLDRSPALDRVFHALAHPVRRAMVRRLVEGELNLSELAAPLRMSFPAAAKHVRTLERAKLVRSRMSGRQRLCRLEPSPLKDACAWTEQFRAQWEARFQALDRLLGDMQRDLEPSISPPQPRRAAPVRQGATRSKRKTTNKEHS